MFIMPRRMDYYGCATRCIQFDESSLSWLQFECGNGNLDLFFILLSVSFTRNLHTLDAQILYAPTICYPFFTTTRLSHGVPNDLYSLGLQALADRILLLPACHR
jgi:hypothetical protein